MIKHNEQLFMIIRRSYEFCYTCIMFKDNVKYIFENFANCDEVAKFYNNILKNWHFDIYDDGIVFNIEKYTYPSHTNYIIGIYTRQYLQQIFRNTFNMNVDRIILKEGEQLTQDRFRVYKPTYKEIPDCHFVYKHE